MLSRRARSNPWPWIALLLTALLTARDAGAQIVRRPGSLFLPLTGTAAPVPSSRVDHAAVQVVNGAQGCGLRCADWELSMPSGVFNGVAMVTLSDMSNTVPQANLDLSNPGLNHFDVAATLIYHCPSDVDPLTREIVWWDPVGRIWVPVPGLVADSERRQISIPLSHFSTYAVRSKAGW